MNDDKFVAIMSRIRTRRREGAVGGASVVRVTIVAYVCCR